MSDQIGQATFKLVVDSSQYEKDLTKAETTAKTKSKSIMGSFGGIQTVLGGGAGAALGMFAGDLGKQMLELDDAVAHLGATSGISGDNLDSLKGDIIDLSKNCLESQTTIAGVIEGLATLQQVDLTKLNPEQVKELTKAYLDWALVTKTDAVGAVGQFDEVLDAWGLTTNDAMVIMDKLTLSHRKFGLVVDGSAATLRKLAPTFQTFGLSLDDSIAYLNLFAVSGIDADSSVLAFSKAVGLLTDKTDVSQKKLQQMGEEMGMTQEAIDALLAADPATQFKTFTAAIGQIEDPTKRAQLAIDLFGSKAGPKLAQALAESKGSMDGFKVSTEESTGATAEAANVIEHSFGNRLKLLKKEIMGRAQELSQSFGPALMGIGMLGPGVMGAIGGIGGAMFKLGPAIAGAASSFAALLPVLVTPPVCIVLAIAAIAAGIALLIMNWDKVGPKLAQGAAFLKDKFLGAVTYVKDQLEKHWKEIVTVALAILFPPGAGLFAIVTNSFGIRDKLIGIFKAIPGEAKKILARIPGLLADLPELFGRAAALAVAAMILYYIGLPKLFITKVLPKLFEVGKLAAKKLFEGWVALMKFQYITLPKFIIETLVDLAPKALELGKNMALKLFEGAKNFIILYYVKIPEFIFNAIKDLIPKAIELGKNMALKIFEGWITLPGKIIGSIPTIVAAIGQVVGGVLKGFGEGWAQVNQMTGNMAQDVVNSITGIPGKLGSLAKTLFGAGKDLMQGMWDGMTSLLGAGGAFALDIGKGIANAAIGFINTQIIDNFNAGIDAIGFSKWGVSFNLGDLVPDVPHIPTLHGGGLVPGMFGKEAVALLEAGELVVPANLVRIMAKGARAPSPTSIYNTGGNANNTFNVAVNVAGMVDVEGVRQQILAEVARQFDREAANAGMRSPTTAHGVGLGRL